MGLKFGLHFGFGTFVFPERCGDEEEDIEEGEGRAGDEGGKDKGGCHVLPDSRGAWTSTLPWPGRSSRPAGRGTSTLHCGPVQGGIQE